MLDFGDYGFELLFGVAWGSTQWALAGVAGWWLMFLAPLGRRKFTSRARIAATPEKISNAYVLGPAPKDGWSGAQEIRSREFLPGPPSRLRLEMRHRSGPKEFKSVVFDITAFEAPRLFEDQILSIDGVATEPGKAGRERLLLTPVGQSTQASLTFEVSVRGLYNLLHLRHFFARVMDRLRAHCEDRPMPGAARGLGWKTNLALGAVALLGTMGLMGDDSVFALPIFLIALLLEIVVVVNEFGHWLAMRWFGHRDATMTLIPFFGGAAIGGKPSETAFEKSMIALMGPAFSALVILLLAIPLKFWYADSPLHGSHAVSDLPTICKFLVGAVAAAFVLIATPLNLFNLVPVSMFDGARAVDALAESRLGRALARLALFGGLTLATWGLVGWLDLASFSGTLAMVMVLGVMGRNAPTPAAPKPMLPRQRAIVAATLALTLCILGGSFHFMLGGALGVGAWTADMNHARTADKGSDPCYSLAFEYCDPDPAGAAFVDFDPRPIFISRELASYFARPARYYASVPARFALERRGLAREWSSRVLGDLSPYVATPRKSYASAPSILTLTMSPARKGLRDDT
jgi:Zn-dependent protease